LINLEGMEERLTMSAFALQITFMTHTYDLR
jgi:hypothetical protein